MGIRMNFDVRKKGNTLLVGIVQREDTINDIEVIEVDLTEYEEKYVKGKRNMNHYDYMLIGFDELVNYMTDLNVYEEGDITIEYNNQLLFTWLENGLSENSKSKYLLKYETILNHLEELIANLGDTTISFGIVKKNEAKKHLTDSALLKKGIVSDNNESNFQLNSKTDLSKNRTRRTSRVTGKDLSKKVIKLNQANG